MPSVEASKCWVPLTHSGLMCLGIWGLPLALGLIIDSERLFPYHTRGYNEHVRMTVELAEEYPETNYTVLSFWANRTSRREIFGLENMFMKIFVFIFLLSQYMVQQKLVLTCFY